jgi:hypothetical protein
MADVTDTTEIKSWPKMTPTPSERLAGRFMRAPDHDAGTGDAAGSGGADSDASGGSDAQGGAADQGSDGNDAADTSLLEAAGSAAGSGNDGEGGDDSGKEAGKDGADAEGAADGPPEAYELAAVKIAGEDGAEIEVPIDQALLTEATPFFKDAGLSNEQAQKLAPLALKVQERVVAQQADEFATLRAGWAKEAKADKEIGGKNWAETESFAAKALDTFGAPEGSDFRKLLTESGFGDHPEMIRMFRRVGEKLGEDKPSESSAIGKSTKPDRVRTLYPNDPPKEEVKQ